MPDTARAAAGAARPVAGRGKMTPRGYQPENAAFLDQLTEHAGIVARIGRDPGTIPLDVLTAAGHLRCGAKSPRKHRAASLRSGCCSR
jgi:hypothetical protein